MPGRFWQLDAPCHPSGVPRYELDHMRWDYYAEIGYNPVVVAQVAQEDGMAGVARYWKPFEAYAVERIGGLSTRDCRL